MGINLDRNLILLLIGLGCAYEASPSLAALLAAAIVFVAVLLHIRTIRTEG